MHFFSIYRLAIATSLVLSAAAAPPNTANELFKYVDSSCKNGAGAEVRPEVDSAVKDMNSLVAAAERSLHAMTNDEGSNEAAFDQWFARPNIIEDRVENAKTVAAKYASIGSLLVPKSVSLYCDGSAFTFVTEIQEGPERGQRFLGGGGRWYAPPGRRAPGSDPLYIKGIERNDYCNPPGGPVTGIAAVKKNAVILCPAAFTVLPLRALPSAAEAQPTGKLLDALETPGGTLLHEFTHAVFGTSTDEKYGTFQTLALVREPGGGIKAIRNADNYLFYAMASFFNQNDWKFGVAKTPFKQPTPAGTAKRMLRRVAGYLNALLPRKLGGVSFGSKGGSTGSKHRPTKPAVKPAPKSIEKPTTRSAPKSVAKSVSRAATPLKSAAKSLSSAATPSSAVTKTVSGASLKSSPTSRAPTSPTSTSSPTLTRSVSNIFATEAINFATSDDPMNAQQSSAEAAFLATLYGSAAGAPRLAATAPPVAASKGAPPARRDQRVATTLEKVYV